MICVFTTCSILLSPVAGPAQEVLYVMEGGAGDCSSWGTACDLQGALGIAQSGDEIWVAAGTYTPTEPGGDRYATFQLISGVAIYGGFADNETERNQRDWETNETILSGDLNGDDGPDFSNYDENSYHVVIGSWTDGSAILDGFTITGGHANGPYPNQLGGGMYNNGGSPTVTHCTFIGNLSTGGSGAGMYNIGGSSPTVSNCTFSGNWAKISAGDYGGAGGGIFNSGSNPTVTNCIFSGNLAGRYGGAMVNGGGSPTISNCTFSGNSADENGDGIFCASGSNPRITNCILWGNSPEEVYVNSAAPVITYCDVQGGWPGEGNIDVDPLFAGADLHLLPGSPCIDSGHILALPPDTPDLDDDGDTTEPTPFDLEGNPRLANGSVDMGAYEQPADCNGNGLSDMQDILDGSSADCTGNWVPDECEADCNGNGSADSCDIADGVSEDCNHNLIPDECDLAEGTSQDNNGNGVPDECEQPQNVLYVKEGGMGIDCSSWSDACDDLQDALAIALPGDEIWVAAGRYTPTWLGLNRFATFQLISSVALYGGFIGDETQRDQRDWKTNETILSGDIYGDDGPDFANNSENSYHVVTADSTDTTAVLDGFTITGGNADLVIFMIGEVHGAALLTEWGSPTVKNCLFRGNSAYASGGAVYLSRSNPSLINCTFSGNQARDGGALYAHPRCHPKVINCSFLGNSASSHAGAMFIGLSGSTITNCTFFGNSSGWGSGGLYISYHISNYSTIVTNCIFWNNSGYQILAYQSAEPNVTFSCIEGGYEGAGNIDDDPLFVDALNGDLRLSTFSPAIDAGDNSVVTEPRDLGGSPRIVDGNGDDAAIVDIGAFEASYDPDDCNGNGVADVEDLASGTSPDCNNNGMPDECDLFAGSCLDCNGNNVPDVCDIADSTSEDCNYNIIPDECDLLADTSRDCDLNGVLDECDIAAGTSSDCNGNGVPDQCDIGFSTDQWASYVIDFSSQYSEPDYSAAQALGEPDVFVYGDSPNAWRPAAEFGTQFLTLGFAPVFADGVTIRITFGWTFVIQVDVLDLDSELHTVWSGFEISDPGEVINFLVTWPLTDYLVKGVKVYIINLMGTDWLQIDAMQLHSTIVSTSDDCNENGVPDECEFGAVPWSLSNGPLPNDCNGNGVLDECDIADCDGSPWCDDCNENGVPDECDITLSQPWSIHSSFSEDCNDNGIPDECEDDPCPLCDLNGDGIVDRIDLGIMRRCLSQVDPPNEEDCEVADLDGDGQVTWRDWKLFIECYRQYIGPLQIDLHRALAP